MLSEAGIKPRLLYENMDKKIIAYKRICELADVPRILIEYPELILNKKPSQDDLNWALQSIREYEYFN